MKILWINHRDQRHPEAGGAEVHIAEVGKRLVKMGHEVTLLAERFEGSKPCEEIDGIQIVRFGGKFTLHIYAPYFVKRNAGRYDIIVDDIAHAVPFWSPKFTEKPVVAIIHHVHQRVVEKELPPIIRDVVKKAERTIDKTYKNIVAVSHTTKEDLIQQLGVREEKITVIYSGVDHKKYKPGPKFEEPTIVWMGRLKKYKNVDHLIRAFKPVKEDVKSARLLIIGSGEEEENLRKLVSEMKLSGVTFTGWLREEDKIRVLQGAWCITYVSEVEGWGMGVLEANACGTPAVGYNSGALKEAIIDGETGILLKYGDIRGLAEALKEIIRNESLRRRLSENAIKYSQKFDWSETASQIESYLQDLL